MEKWFDKKLEKRNLRVYTMRRLKDYNNNHNINKFNAINSIPRKLSITNWLIIINTIVYILLVLFRILDVLTENKLLSIFALQAKAFFSGAYWTLLTSMFSHVWLPHLIFNMISLFFIGNFLERIIGRKKFLWFYLISGIFAGFFYSTLSFYFGATEIGSRIFINPDSYSVGASGAIFGLAGLLAVLTPFMRVYLIAGPIFALIVQAIIKTIFPASEILSIIDLFIMIYIFLSIFSIFSFNPTIRKLAVPIGMPFWILPIFAIVPLIIIGLFVQLPIGNTAHLGGLIVGILYGIYIKNKYKRKTEMIKTYFR